MVKVTINGRTQNVSQANTLDQLIHQVCKDNHYAIAELNGTVIKSQLWNQTPIQDGDQLELVSIVGGG